MIPITSKRPTWKTALRTSKILILPAAHDALTARLIQRAGFKAFQVGGFALDGSRYAFPDVDLTHFGEKSAAFSEIISASSLPVMVDGDDGYGDVKNVTRTVLGYQAMGVSALFIEDQKAPKRCGHMAKKEIIPAKDMEAKIKAALGVRDSTDSLFLLARTDAIGPHGLREALSRGGKYLKAGADGIYFDGVQSEKELIAIGKAFKNVPLATSILENGGKTPFLPPEHFQEMGFSMLLYPTTVLFRMTRAIERALADLGQGKPIPPGEGVDMEMFEQIVDMPYWKEIEKKYQGKSK